MINKPPADELLNIWKRALAADGGINLSTRGITSSMVYWADVLYAKPAEEKDSHESIGFEAVTEDYDENLEWSTELTGDQAKFVKSFSEKLNFDIPSPDGDDAPNVQTLLSASEDLMGLFITP
jgi:hypothetical protein